MPSLLVENLEVPTGTILALLGSSGSGKTTLLRFCGGFLRPEADNHWVARSHDNAAVKGSVFFDDRDVSFSSPRERRVALLAQGLHLYPHMTAREIIEFPLRMSGEDGLSIARRVGLICERLGLSPLLGRRPVELSGGEQQRVALAKALVQVANVRLLDEPMSSLDAPLRRSLRQDLRMWLRERPTTTLYITHDPEEALEQADFVGVVERGQVLQVDRPERIYANPTSWAVARILWAGRMVALRGKRSCENGRSRVKIGSWEAPISPDALGAEKDVVVVAPRDSFAIVPVENGNPDVFSGIVVGTRFSADAFLVEIRALDSVFEVPCNFEKPKAGDNVCVRLISPKRLRIFAANSLSDGHMSSPAIDPRNKSGFPAQ